MLNKLYFTISQSLLLLNILSINYSMCDVSVTVTSIIVCILCNMGMGKTITELHHSVYL